jgi:hypothetical protein
MKASGLGVVSWSGAPCTTELTSLNDMMTQASAEQGFERVHIRNLTSG